MPLASKVRPKRSSSRSAGAGQANRDTPITSARYPMRRGGKMLKASRAQRWSLGLMLAAQLSMVSATSFAQRDVVYIRNLSTMLSSISRKHLPTVWRKPLQNEQQSQRQNEQQSRPKKPEHDVRWVSYPAHDFKEIIQSIDTHGIERLLYVPAHMTGHMGLQLAQWSLGPDHTNATRVHLSVPLPEHLQKHLGDTSGFAQINREFMLWSSRYGLILSASDLGYVDEQLTTSKRLDNAALVYTVGDENMDAAIAVYGSETNDAIEVHKKIGDKLAELEFITEHTGIFPPVPLLKRRSSHHTEAPRIRHWQNTADRWAMALRAALFFSAPNAGLQEADYKVDISPTLRVLSGLLAERAYHELADYQAKRSAEEPSTLSPD